MFYLRDIRCCPDASNNPTQSKTIDQIEGTSAQIAAFLTGPVASTIALHPYAETWLTVLDLCEGSKPELDHPPAMVDDYDLKIYHRQVTGELTIPEAILSCLNDELLRDIRVMSNRFPTSRLPI